MKIEILLQRNNLFVQIENADFKKFYKDYLQKKWTIMLNKWCNELIEQQNLKQETKIFSKTKEIHNFLIATFCKDDLLKEVEINDLLKKLQTNDDIFDEISIEAIELLHLLSGIQFIDKILKTDAIADDIKVEEVWKQALKACWKQSIPLYKEGEGFLNQLFYNDELNTN
ncbi:1077_t:CDS:2, partial [Racocetra fulgida]